VYLEVYLMGKPTAAKIFTIEATEPVLKHWRINIWMRLSAKISSARTDDLKAALLMRLLQAIIFLVLYVVVVN